ncbi:MAG: dihydroorotase, partial [Rhodospirillales bacterium]|nr:dihydroorotase [Rhodospirillales bacterium]
MESYDLVVRGGAAYTTAGLVPADIGVRAGRIAAIGDLGSAKAAAVFDAAGLTV